MLGTAGVVCLVTEQGLDGVLVCECEQRGGGRGEAGVRARRGVCNFILVKLQLLRSTAQNSTHSANFRHELQLSITTPEMFY